MEDREAAWASAMRAARRGDAVAYARLLDEIAVLLRREARARLRRMGFGEAEAEDVVQETLMALHLKRHTWDEDRPFLPWLRAIARYKSADAGRRLARARRRIAETPVEDLADRLAAPEAARIGLDAGRSVEALPRREREVVSALALEGGSVSAVARRFAIAEAAVRVAFHRGLRRLARMSEDADVEGRIRRDADRRADR